MNNKQYLSWLTILMALLFMTFVAVLLSLKIGEVSYTWVELWEALVGGNEELDFKREILLKLRLPRVLLGFTVGAALSIAGVVLQGLFRNPLVEPYTLGISGGASVAIAVTIVGSAELMFGELTLPLMGFIGAAVTVFFVYKLALSRERVQIQTLLLTGVMVSFISSSVMMLLLSLARHEKLQGILFWTMGGLNESRMNLILLLCGITIVAFLLVMYFAPMLNGLRLGMDRATQLGINTEKSVRLLFLLSSLLTGLCVSLVGVIGFVGLIIPQMMRLLVGGDFRILLPTAFLGGGIFLILCDIFARVIISPNELPIGVVTGIIGGVIFVVLMSNMKKEKV